MINVQYVFDFVLLFGHQFVSCLSGGSTTLGQVRHADQKIDLPCVDLRAIQQAQLVQLVSVQLQNRRVLRHCLVRQWQCDCGIIQLIVTIPATTSIQLQLCCYDKGRTGAKHRSSVTHGKSKNAIIETTDLESVRATVPFNILCQKHNDSPFFANSLLESCCCWSAFDKDEEVRAEEAYQQQCCT